MHDDLALSFWRRMDAWLTNAGVGTRATHAILILATLGLLGAVYGLVRSTGGTQGPYLHMAYVPILRKPGPLTPDEFEEVEAHCELGHTILLNVSDDFETIASGVFAHHERWDGGGYPHGLARDAIPIFGRIVAAADVFEAITSYRPQRHPLTNDEALAVLEEGRGKHFDPRVVGAFMTAYRAGRIGLESGTSVDSQAFVDAVLHPETIGRDLVEDRLPWRARVVN